MRYQVCVQCGKQFKTYPSEVGRARFCSKQCMADDRRGKPMPWEAGMLRGYRFPNINTYRTEGDTSFVVMCHGIEAVIDTADLPFIRQFVWTPTFAKPIGHSYTITRVRDDSGQAHTKYMHRLILDAPSGMVVDHINHNSLDNRRSNLRVCTHSENMYNRKGTDPRSRTGIQGVSIQTNGSGRQYYLARVTVTRLFPFTDKGLRDATALAVELRQRVGNTSHTSS